MGLEVRAVAGELAGRIPLRIRKVYGISRDLYSLTVRGPGGTVSELIAYLGGAVYLSSYKWRKPMTPPQLAMGMRKWISGGTIEEVRQLDFDRVLRLGVRVGEERFDLWVELFGGGNLVLVDGKGNILQVARPITVRGRELRRGREYLPPPTSGSRSPPLTVEEIVGYLSESEREIWKSLAYGWGMGPPYLDEVLGGEVDPRAKSRELDSETLESMAERVVNLLKSAENPEPTMYLEEGEVREFSLRPLDRLRERFEEERRFDGGFSEMLDAVLSPAIALRLGGEGGADERLMASAGRQAELAVEYSHRAKVFRMAAERMFSELARFQAILDLARAGKTPPGFRLDRARGRLIWDVSGEEIGLSVHLSAAENASRLYDKAKILEKKAERAREAAENLKMRSKGPPAEEVPLIIRRERRRWFERFRWFESSEGFLVVAGRDRSTNRELVRRYMRPRDFFLHVDMPGGSVVVVRSEGEREPGDATLREASVYAACYSRAWKQGLSRADVYCVRGDQVSVHAPPGMFIPKGSFYVSGERRYFRPELRLRIGLIEMEGRFSLISAPPSASDRMVVWATVVPGGVPREEAVHILKGKLEAAARKVGLELTLSEEAVRSVLPPGGVEVIDERGGKG